jgi:glycosyltransferase involved in cell wall biosynthesis
MENWTDSFEVYYDLTRLVERMHARHATGVDRVDLHYALWMRARVNKTRFLVQRSSGFVLLKDHYVDALLNHLSQCWLGLGEGHAGLDIRQPSGWHRESRRALREKLARGTFGAVRAERGIAAALWSRLPGFSHASSLAFAACEDLSNAMYVNVGHCMRFESLLASIPDQTRRMYFLHDVIPLTHPDTQKATSQLHFRQFCHYINHPMSNVIVSSRATMDAIAALMSYAPQQFGSVASLNVLPLAVEDRFKTEKLEGNRAIRSRGKQAKDYFLSVGTIEPRKNLELLVVVWEQLIELGEGIPKLLWVGKFGWSCDKQLMRRFERLQQQGHAELRAGVSDSELLVLMARATALLCPSKIEGWGLPLSEALAMGLPVIASDICVFREVGQGVPDLIDSDDVVAWRDAILDYAKPRSVLRDAQMMRLVNYLPITWAEHFDGLKVADL